MMSYGYPYKEDFISLESLRMMHPVTKASDFKLPAAAKHTSPTNTAPRIDRSKMRAEYRVPKGTFFTIPVYATDAEQSSLLYAFNQFGCHSGNPATFPVFPPQHDAKLSFGRRYGGASMIANSDEIPVGNYQFWLSVSDALPVEEAIAKKQAPLYDGYIANVKVVNATPFKITSNIASQYAMGQKLTLKWSVDKTFFKEGSKVRVVMSDDFGETFSHVLVPSTANDGECEVYLPQKLMEKFSTYFNIWFAGKGLIRLETIDDDFQYYDLSNNALVDGGIEVVKSPVTFEGLPTNNYLKLAADAPLPPAPQVTAKVNHAPVVPSFSETTEGNMTIRTWWVQQGGEVYGGQQFIEREVAETPEIPETPETPKEVKVQQITLTPSASSVVVGESLQIAAKVLPENATNATLKWKITPENILKPTAAPGQFTAQQVGEALVRAKAVDGSGITAECRVVVKPRLVQSISLNATQKELIIGDSFTLTATAMPENATNRNVVWKLVSGDAISLSNTGVIQAKKVGEALVRAEAADGSGVSAECKVVVKPRLVQSISLNATQKELIIGDAFSLTATAMPENATNRNVIWKLVSGDAITLSADGVIQAKKVGEALVRAEAADGSGITAECKVVVKPRLVQAISLNATQKSLIIGDSFTLTATAMPENATNRNIVWKLVSGDAISLSNTGIIQAKKVGEALVRAEAVDGSGITAECKVIVKPRLVQAISLKLEKDTVAVGEHFTVTADVLPKNATNSTLQWSVSAPLLLKHLGAGSFEALKTGSATITAQARDGSKQEASCRIEIVPPTALKKAVAADVAPQVSVDGNTLVVKQVPSGQWLHILDVQGRLLHQMKSYGEPLRIVFPQMPQVLLLKVAQRSYKVLLAQP